MSAGRVPIQERLNAEAERKRENREKIKRVHEIEAMKECSFKPKTNGDVFYLPKYPRLGT